MSRTLAVAAIWLAAVISAAAQADQPIGTVDDFIGGYQSPSGDVIKVVVQGNRLFWIAPTGEKNEVTPTAPVTFLRDASGRATHLVMREEQWPRIVVPTDVLARYAGVYPLSPALSMTVSLEGDRLMVQAPGASKHPLHPLSSTRFFVQDSASTDSAELEFGGIEEGMPFVIFRQGGGVQKVPRQ